MSGVVWSNTQFPIKVVDVADPDEEDEDSDPDEEDDDEDD